MIGRQVLAQLMPRRRSRSNPCGGLRRLVDRTVGGHRAGGTVLQRAETAVQPTRPLARFGSLLLAWPAARLGLWRAVIRIG